MSLSSMSPKSLIWRGDYEKFRVTPRAPSETDFRATLGFANHVGLYAEDTGHRGNALGNFPASFHAPRPGPRRVQLGPRAGARPIMRPGWSNDVVVRAMPYHG